jgi:hypothetical protein
MAGCGCLYCICCCDGVAAWQRHINDDVLMGRRSSKMLVVDFGCWYCIYCCGGADAWRRRINDDYDTVWFFQKVCCQLLVMS